MRNNLLYLNLVAFALLSVGPIAYGATAPPQKAAERQVRVVAYINQTSGCQKPTEAVLNRLAEKYKGHLKLELVDFGGKGRSRWLRDGMHCMGIRINGSVEADIVEKGVPLRVRFQMPAGYNWTLEELEIAVRQAIQGVSDSDRRPPPVSVEKTKDGARLLIGGTAVLSLPEADRITRAADVLKANTPEKRGLTREDFSFDLTGAAATIRVRGQPLLEVFEADAQRLKTPLPALAARWTSAVSAPYPVRTRPLPNARRRRSQGGIPRW
ncbi:MAG: hypothetical protein GXP31_19075 [Kiritimatiellaeota bacterium]|nr:hypothetical protein [Kiritimatiellota bacterium]